MALAGYGDKVEGLHAVEAAVPTGGCVSSSVERLGNSDAGVARIVKEAVDRGGVIRWVDTVDEWAATTAPQGLVAGCRPRRPVALDELVMASSPAAILVLDHIEDPHNLGAIARSAVAAGMPRLVVPARRNAPSGRRRSRRRRGRSRCATWRSSPRSPKRSTALGGFAVWTVGLDPAGERSLFGLELLAEPVAVIVGGEGGLHRLVRERVDVVSFIPMAGEIDSLNASVAAALACFEVMRVREGSIAGSLPGETLA